MATIVMESAKVIEAAQKVIDHIHAHRKARDDKAIAKRMARRALGWRGFYYMTEAQAIKALDNSDCWGWRSVYAWGDLDHAEKLKKLAQHGDPVTLNEEDVRVLF